MKSFMHELLFYLYLYMSSEHTLLFQLHRLRSRTFSLKINKLPTLKSLMLKIVLIDQMSSHTEFQLTLCSVP